MKSAFRMGAAQSISILRICRAVRLRPDLVEQAVAEQDAKAFARTEQDKLDSQ
jgi:hypothetical protein